MTAAVITVLAAGNVVAAGVIIILDRRLDKVRRFVRIQQRSINYLAEKLEAARRRENASRRVAR